MFCIFNQRSWVGLLPNLRVVGRIKVILGYMKLKVFSKQIKLPPIAYSDCISWPLRMLQNVLLGGLCLVEVLSDRER